MPTEASLARASRLVVVVGAPNGFVGVTLLIGTKTYDMSFGIDASGARRLSNDIVSALALEFDAAIAEAATKVDPQSLLGVED